VVRSARSRGLRIGLFLALVAAVAAVPYWGLARAGCSVGSRFLSLRAAVGDVVGNCVEEERFRPELGMATQRTSNGTLVWNSLDGVTSFSDGVRTWVLDPSGQVVERGALERLPFEFNGDGLPLVGSHPASTDGPCPVEPLVVVAVENFYADLVRQLGGQCVLVTTLLSDPDADPHEFEPSAEDVRAFSGADLVVENGLAYDDFANRILATLGRKPEVLNAGDVVGLDIGANPHLWYGAEYVADLRTAITDALKQLRPDAGAYFDAQSAELSQRFRPYEGLVEEIRTEFGETPVAATESIVVDLADSTGLHVVTPPGFMMALSEGSDPTAQDLATFQEQLRRRQAKALLYNVQTVTPITSQLADQARDNGIPVLGMSETMPPGAQTFQGWQSAQLQLLLNALRQSSGA